MSTLENVLDGKKLKIQLAGGVGIRMSCEKKFRKMGGTFISDLRVIDSGTHPLLHPDGHHKIIHCKLTRSSFLDISKAFVKVWQKGLLYKLESLGISGNLLNLFCSFLNDRHQRVVLNG